MQFNHEKKEDGGKFVKLDDGGSVQGVLFGDPFEYFSRWDNDKSVKCKPNEPDAKFRFKINMIVKENEAYSAKIIEFGWSVYKSFKTLTKDGYKLDRTVIKITREGTKLNTKYNVIPVPNGDVKDDLYKQFSKMELNDLNVS